MVKNPSIDYFQPNPDSNLTDDPTESLQVKKIPRSFLRHQIAKYFAPKGKQQRQKVSKFTERLDNGQFGHLLDRSRLECPFCLELLVLPVSIACGHIFCRRCLDANMAHSPHCCLCRAASTEQQVLPCLQVQVLINKFIVPKEDDAIQYLCRVSQAHQWLSMRSLLQLKKDQIVDFRDNFRIWRRAKVVGFTEEEGNTMVELRVANRPPSQKQKVDITSKRLAPPYFFSKKKYLDDYGPSLMAENEEGDHLWGLDYRLNQNMTEMEGFLAVEEIRQENDILQAEFLEEQRQQPVQMELNMALFHHEMDHIEDIIL